MASDILHLLISYVDHLQKFPPETPKKIVEVRHIVYPKKTSLQHYNAILLYCTVELRFLLAFIQILIATITYLLPSTESSPHEQDKRVKANKPFSFSAHTFSVS